jgi:hypothetical protein
MLESGRLPGAMAFAKPPTSWKRVRHARLQGKVVHLVIHQNSRARNHHLRTNAVVIVAVQATQLPSASAVEKCVVCFLKTSVSAFSGVCRALHPWRPFPF